MTNGERIIREILEKTNFGFQQEYTFPNLKSYRGKKLRYDFVVFNSDLSIKCLIEFHGVQHYQYVKHFYKQRKEWNYQREMDLLKARYALMNDIPLYVIPYTDIDVIKTFSDITSDKYRIKTKWYLYNTEE